jgi:hypothetical protein
LFIVEVSKEISIVTFKHSKAINNNLECNSENYAKKDNDKLTKFSILKGTAKDY